MERSHRGPVSVCSRLPACAAAGAAAGLLATVLTACGATALQEEGLLPTATPAPSGRDVRVLPSTADQREYLRLAAGRYRVPLPPLLVTDVDVPAGWSVHGGHYLSAAPGGEGQGTFFVAAAPPTTTVPVDPCHDHAGRRVGPSTRDLAQALASSPFLRDDEPQRVVVGGRRGWVVRLVVPRTYDVTTCQQHTVHVWSPGAPEDAWQVTEPGTVVRLWVLDVDGERHVVHTETGPDATPADAERLRRMVASIGFVRVE